MNFGNDIPLAAASLHLGNLVGVGGIGGLGLQVSMYMVSWIMIGLGFGNLVVMVAVMVLVTSMLSWQFATKLQRTTIAAINSQIMILTGFHPLPDSRLSWIAV